MPQSSFRPFDTCAMLALAAGLAAGITGCSGSGGAADDAGLSTGLNALSDPDRQPSAAAGSEGIASEDPGRNDAVDLLEQARRASLVTVDSGGPGPQANTQKPVMAEERLPVPAGAPIAQESAAPPQALAAEATPPTLEQRRSALAGELAGVLRAQAETSPSPATTLAQMAALEMIEPGIASDLGAADQGWPALSPAERRVLDAWRGMFVDARSKIESPGSDVVGLADAMRTASHNAGSVQPMRIICAALCTRVDGFGVYGELARFGDQYKLLAGRQHRLVVYVEVDRFAARPKSLPDSGGASGFEVSLTQDLSLYHAGKESDLLAWRKPDQQIVDASRNVRRDFFVTQLIELPETLTVGSYRLKVRMTDGVGGATAEAIIPIDVVADASAMRQ